MWKIEKIACPPVSFQNLTNLEILRGHGLINLFTSQQRKVWYNSRKCVSECERIAEVIVGRGGGEVITFAQLTYLKLDCLPKLTSFCLASHSFEFPSLEEVIVRYCPKVKAFCHGPLWTPELESTINKRR